MLQITILYYDLAIYCLLIAALDSLRMMQVRHGDGSWDGSSQEWECSVRPTSSSPLVTSSHSSHMSTLIAGRTTSHAQKPWQMLQITCKLWESSWACAPLDTWETRLGVSHLLEFYWDLVQIVDRPSSLLYLSLTHVVMYKSIRPAANSILMRSSNEIPVASP